MLKDILYIIVTGCAGTLVTFLCALLKTKIAQITQNKYVSLVTDIVTDACNTVAMTYVDNLKKAGAFTTEAQELAKKKATDIVNDLVTNKAKEVLTEAYGDFSTWVSSKIESVLKEQKEA